MIRYDALQESELFAFFGIEETGRGEPEDGLTPVFLKPGGFQEHIDLIFHVDASGIVRRAALLLDRAWIGDASQVNPFGKDMAKSFVAGMVTAEDHDRVRAVVEGLWALQGERDQVIHFGDPPPPRPAPGPDAQALLAAYVGKAPRSELALTRGRLVFENLEAEGRQRLRILVRCEG